MSQNIPEPLHSRSGDRAYPGAKLEIANKTLDKLIPVTRLTLSSKDHVFRIGGKTIQMSDLHLCNDHEVGLANFVKLMVVKPSK